MPVIYESKRYPALGFYVDGAFKRFSSGVYVAEDGAEIAVLDGMVDVSRVSDDVAEISAESPQEIPEKPEVKPAPKTRKPSAK